MADTRVQLEVEDWVRRTWMAEKFGSSFHRERVHLSSGGVFDFDAVSPDRSIIATISTSGARTGSGNYAVGKIMKIRSDMFFLLLTSAERRLVVLTEEDMYNQCLTEAQAGRVPPAIEFVHARIPAELDARLRNARTTASKEMSARLP